MKFRDTLRSVASIYAHNRGVHVQLKYRKSYLFFISRKNPFLIIKSGRLIRFLHFIGVFVLRFR